MSETEEKVGEEEEESAILLPIPLLFPLLLQFAAERMLEGTVEFSSLSFVLDERRLTRTSRRDVGISC